MLANIKRKGTAVNSSREIWLGQKGGTMFFEDIAGVSPTGDKSDAATPSDGVKEDGGAADGGVSIQAG